MKKIDVNKSIKFIENSDCVLHKNPNIILKRLYQNTSRKKVLLAVAISIFDEIVCDDFFDVTLFSKELENFKSVDDTDNIYLKNKYKKIGNIDVKKLYFKSEKGEIYFSKTLVETMISIYKTSTLGYSLIKLPENHSYTKLIETHVEMPLKVDR